MKKIILLFNIFIVFSAIAMEKDYQLILTTDDKYIQVNEIITLKLIIKGKHIVDIYGNIKVNDDPDSNSDEFVNFIHIKPEKTGEMTLGPYNLNFQGNNLTSNTVKINVTERLNDVIQIKSDQNEVKVNMPFKVSLISNDYNIKFDEVDMKYTYKYSVKKIGTSSSTTFINGTQSTKVEVEFSINPLVKGKIKINKNSFTNLNYEIPELEIIVR